MADSVTIVADAVGMDLADARDLIVDSDTWEDRRDAALELNDQLADAFLEFGVAQDDGSIIVDLTDLDDGTERPKQG